MKSLQKYFIPHENNEYKPHLLRNEVAFAILALVLIIEGAFLSQAMLFGRGTGFLALVLPNTLVDETNQNRTAIGLPPLLENPLLTAAAQEKANDMAAKGYFAHTSPEGLTPWHWFQKIGYSYTHAGENLAVNFSDSQDVTNAWMNSPDHKANILNSSYTQIGIATAQGMYEGRSTVFVVQMFAKPAVPKTVPVVATKPAPKPSTTPAPKPAPAPEPIVVAAVQPIPVSPPQQNFVAVEGVATTAAPVVATKPSDEVALNKPTGTRATSGTAGTTQSDMTPQSNFVQRIFAAPRLTANVIYAILGGLILLALLLNVFVKVSVQHPQLVLNGLMILLTIGTLAVFNQQVLLANAKIF